MDIPDSAPPLNVFMTVPIGILILVSKISELRVMVVSVTSRGWEIKESVVNESEAIRNRKFLIIETGKSIFISHLGTADSFAADKEAVIFFLLNHTIRFQPRYPQSF